MFTFGDTVVISGGIAAVGSGVIVVHDFIWLLFVVISFLVDSLVIVYCARMCGDKQLYLYIVPCRKELKDWGVV